jgi:hypothetical protein
MEDNSFIKAIELCYTKFMIKYAIIILVAIIVLSFFGYDLKKIVEAPTTQGNLSYVWGGVTYVWENWLEQPIKFAWEKIFIGILWNAFVHNLERIDSGAPTELQNMGSRLLDIENTGSRPLEEY